MQRTIFLTLILLTLTISAHAESRYVTDQILVSLRSAPNDTSAPLERLATGTRVDLIEDLGPFFKIKSPTGTIGFVRSQYFVTTAPSTVSVGCSTLQGKLSESLAENKLLADDLQRLKSISASSVTQPAELEKSRNELADLTKRYQDLVKNQENGAAIIEERDALKDQLAKMSKSSNVNTHGPEQWASPLQWFMSGGALLFVGWLAGRSSQSKRRF